MNEREFWMTVRQGLLLVIDAIERRLELKLRTADLRKVVKELKREKTQPEGSEESDL